MDFTTFFEDKRIREKRCQPVRFGCRQILPKEGIKVRSQCGTIKDGN